MKNPEWKQVSFGAEADKEGQSSDWLYSKVIKVIVQLGGH